MFTPGLSFGSRYVVSPMEGQVYDYLPEAMMGRVRNLRDFRRSRWRWISGRATPTGDRWRSGGSARERKFNASFIDQGYCFNAGEWSFPDAPLARASSGATMFMPVSQGGTASSRG